MEADNNKFIANSFPTFLNFPSSTNFLRAWIVEFTVDLGEFSALCVLIFEPFGCTFLHKGGATPDNYRRFEKNISTMWKKTGSSSCSIELYQYLWNNKTLLTNISEFNWPCSKSEKLWLISSLAYSQFFNKK